MRPETRFVGILTIAFGVATFAASVVATLATGDFLVDIGAPVIVLLGVFVLRGSARAARACAVLTACYAILPVLVLVLKAMGTEQLLEGPRMLLSPESVRPLERVFRGLEAPWVTPACLAVGACAAIVTVFLVILIHRLRRAAATQGSGEEKIR